MTDIMDTERKSLSGAIRRLFSCESVTYEEMMALLMPLLLENIITVGITLINASMVSSSGMETLSAVTLIDTYVSMIIHMFQGVSTGAAIIVAQYHGAKRSEQMRESAVSSISIVTIFGLLLSLFSILFRGGIIRLFFGAADPNVLSIASYYMLGNCLSLPFQAFAAAQLGSMRGVGEGRNALIVVISNSVSYLIGNLIFLVILKMSVTGLILSLGISRAFMAVACIVVKRICPSHLVFHLKELLHPEFSYLKRIVKYGFPISFENLLFDGGRMIIQMIITPLGTDMIAGYNIAYNLMTFSQIPNNSITSALFVGAGMCMGAGRPDDLKEWYKRIFKANTAIYILVDMIILALNGPIISFFHVPVQMPVRILHCVMIIFAVEVTVHTAGFMTTTVLRAAGDVMMCTILSAVSMWVFRVIGAYVFGRVLGFGIEGVCIGMAMDWTFRAIVFTHRYRQNRWMGLHVI